MEDMNRSNEYYRLFIYFVNKEVDCSILQKSILNE
jgi:hypothetical protein